MRVRNKLGTVVGVLAVLSGVVLAAGCSSSPSSQPAAPTSSGPAQSAGPHVRVLLGGENYEKAGPKLKVGQKALFKGGVAVAGSRGDEVVIHQASLYTGADKPVSAADLTRELKADKEAFDKKYRFAEIVVEGVVAQLLPDKYSVDLEGDAK
jgi:hypothetical protein